jgi:hypothetical protein
MRRPRSVTFNEFPFVADFTKEVLKSGKIKDLNVIFREVSKGDFAVMTGIPHHHLIGKNKNWLAMKIEYRQRLMAAFDLTEEQVTEILKETKSST